MPFLPLSFSEFVFYSANIKKGLRILDFFSFQGKAVERNLRGTVHDKKRLVFIYPSPAASRRPLSQGER
ncbi:MAG: hypothetical protein BGO67_01140 [Alphaproteobacteria bacterium 41-28]|nr:MAG: hypothetical protein BGO67_01140 [Alphaproteobacteria bacterium 41-28]